MGYGQKQELEANKLSAEYMARIGYNPNAVVKAMAALKNHQLAETQWASEENREPVVYHGVISQQSTADEQLQKEVAAAGEVQVDAISLLKPSNFLSLLEDMIFGDSEINGVRRGRHFYHKELGYTMVFPQGWRIFNQPARLIAVATKGDAMLYTAVQERDESNSPREFMGTVLKLTDIWDGYAISPSKLKGFSAMIETESVFGNRPARINIIFFGNKVFIAIEVTKDDLTLEHYEKTFRTITSSFRPLNKKQEKLAKAYKLGIIRANEKTKFATLAEKLPRLKHADALLRLLNQFPPEGEPEPGKGIKILN